MLEPEPEEEQKEVKELMNDENIAEEPADLLTPNAKEEKKVTEKSTAVKGPKSALADVHDLDDYMKGGYFLEDLDIEQ